MFDWISKLFGGGNQQKSSPTTSRPAQGPSFQLPRSLNGSGSTSMGDMAARAREEERRRREEERRRREAAAAAKKARQDAEARARQLQEQKTVAQPSPAGSLQMPGGLKTVAEINAPKPINTSKFSNQQLLNVKKNPNAPYSLEMKQAANRSGVRDPRDVAKERQEEARQNKIKAAKANLMLNQLWAPAQSGGMDIAKLPGVLAGLIGKDKFADTWDTAIDQSSIPLIGGQWRPTGDKTYSELIADTERAKDMAMNTIYRNGGELSTPERVVQAGAEVFGSLVSPTEAAAGLRAGTNLTRRADDLVDAASLATGGAARGGRFASNASDAADAARRLQIENEARRAAAEAEDAIRQLPDPVQIERQATDAGLIDDGISSPSRVQQAQQTISRQVDEAKAVIQSEYQNQLMGLNDLMNSLTPRPLAMQMAGGPDIDPSMMARQADFEPPAPKPTPTPEPVPELPAPSKTPIAQAIDTPNEAASKAAADAAPAVPPKSAMAGDVKTRTIDDMTDEEIVERFGVTREEMVKRREAARATKEAEEARKAEKKKAKEDKAAEKAAAAEQAAIDAGEAPAKDIFAGKKRSDAAPSKTKPEPATTKSDKKDIFAGKKKAKTTEPTDAELAKEVSKELGRKVTSKQVNNAIVDSLFEPGETLAKQDAKTIAKAMDKKAPTKADPKTGKTGSRSADLEEHADIDPQTNMPKEDAKDISAGKKRTETTSKTEPVVEKTVTKGNDIFAGKKRTEAPAAKATADAPKPTKKPKSTATTAAVDKQVPVKPSKTPPVEKVKTGERKLSQSKSVGTAKSRAMYDEVSRNATQESAENFAKNVPFSDYAKDALTRQNTAVDDLIARAYVAQGRIKVRGTEWGMVKKIIQEARTETGQEMATLARFFRENASSREISLNYEKRFDSRGIHLEDSALKRIDKNAAAYTAARDKAMKLREKAIETKSTKDVDAVEAAMENLYRKDTIESIKAYGEALKSLKAQEAKGVKASQQQLAGLKKFRDETGVFQYGAVDSSILSATGTIINNAINGITVGLEKIAFGKAGAKAARKRTGEIVGGTSKEGSLIGAKEGLSALKREAELRRALNDIEHPKFKLFGKYKNAVTTLNELSEIPIRSRIHSSMYDHYRQINKEAGLTGEQLRNQTRLDAYTDPLNVRSRYADEAYLAQGMSAIKKEDIGNKRLERRFAESIEKGIKAIPGMDTGLKQDAAAKYFGRMTARFFIGFPSVVWRSGVVAGSKRIPLLGQGIDYARYAKAKTTAEKAQIMAEGIEHLGSGITYSAAGVMLGASGIITGAWPKDPNEQKRWQKEGKAEWSIKLPTFNPKTGKVTYDYYDMRKSLGAFALPLMMAAQTGQNYANDEALFEGFLPGIDGKNIKGSSILKALMDVSPVESSLGTINDVVEIMTGEGRTQDLSATIAKAIRMNLPASGLTNEIAKITTAMISGKELEARDASNFGKELRNRLLVAFPGGGEMAGLNARMVDGVEVTSVSPLGRIFGAQKGHNPEGQASNEANQAKANEAASTTRSVGDSTFDKIADTMNDEQKGLYKRVVKDGKSLTPEDQKKVDDAISGLADGDKDFESKFSEEGDWETQDYILQKKKQKYEADKSTKPEKLRELDREIGRTEILSKLEGDAKENATLYKRYKEVSQSELNKMLDDEDTDNYNPELAMKLVAMDEMFTEAELSWKTGVIDGWTKKKYDLDKAKKKAKGGGGGSKNLLATDVSGLKLMESEMGPGLKYKTVSGMPNLMAATPRKNFKKTISIKRGVQL